MRGGTGVRNRARVRGGARMRGGAGVIATEVPFREAQNVFGKISHQAVAYG